MVLHALSTYVQQLEKVNALWGDALPTEETFSSYFDSLVILDDMMDDVVSDSSLQNVVIIKILVLFS